MKKRILCYGDSNTWGYNGETATRFPEDIRWTGQLQTLLGEEWTIIEEGMCSRTTVFDDPIIEGTNGLKYLHPCLSSQSPIDYLIIMLGTNDCKQRFALTPKNIAEGLKLLVKKAMQPGFWRKEPRILLIAPAPICPECESSPTGRDTGICSERSQHLAYEYELVAQEFGCKFLDAAPYVTMNKTDYMHYDAESHGRLAKVLADFLKKVL